MAWVLLLAVFLDLFGVALVVPNIPFLFRAALGDRFSPELYGLISSVYSASQILGGLAIGYLADKSLGRKRTLLLSFVGAGLSYLLIGFAESVTLLILSRVIVGLVKQTMTASTAYVSEITPPHARAAALGRLSSASTLAFLIGQPAGGLLSARLGRHAPCFLAAALFALDFVFVQLALPDAGKSSASQGGDTKEQRGPSAPRNRKISTPGGGESNQGVGGRLQGEGSRAEQSGSSWGDRLRGFGSVFRGLGARVLVARLVYSMLMRASYSLIGVYEQERWALEPTDLGYLSFYKQALGQGLGLGLRTGFKLGIVLGLVAELWLGLGVGGWSKLRDTRVVL